MFLWKFLSNLSTFELCVGLDEVLWNTGYPGLYVFTSFLLQK